MIAVVASEPRFQEARTTSAYIPDLEDARPRSIGDGLTTRLLDVFARIRPLLSGESVSPREAVGSLDEARLGALFAGLAGPLDQARRAGLLTDVWDMAGIGRNEIRTAAALAALWNPRLCGSVAIDFLAAFFARLGSADLPDRAALARGYTINREERPLGEASERVDIVVETREFLVGIELKIDAPEGPDQLARYRNALQARLGFKIMPGKGPPQRLTAALIYLSRDPGNRSDLATIGARWSDVAAAARSAVSSKAGERRFVEQLVAQFAAHVAAF